MSGLPQLHQELISAIFLKAKEMLGHASCVYFIICIFTIIMMEEIRLAIREHRYSEFKKSKLEGFLSKED